MRKPESKRIGDHEYTVTQLPPRQALRAFNRLLKCIGPGLGKALGDVLNGGKLPKSILDIDLKKISLDQVVSSVVDRMDEDPILEVIQWLSECTLMDGKQLSKVFDAHFLGKISELLQWFAFALKVNFSDFLSALDANAVAQGGAAVAA